MCSAQVQTYEEVIQPVRLSSSLMVTAECLAGEFETDLQELIRKDHEEVSLAGSNPLLYSTWSREWNTMWNGHIAGGEEGDLRTPLGKLNERLVARLVTLKAAGLLLNELIDRATEGGTTWDEQAGGLTPQQAAAATPWFRGFCEEWVPRLLLGRDDENRRRLGVEGKGEFRRRRNHDDPLCDGIDAEEFTELIFQTAPLVRDTEDPQYFVPASLLPRLKDLRAQVAAAETSELSRVSKLFDDFRESGPVQDLAPDPSNQYM